MPSRGHAHGKVLSGVAVCLQDAVETLEEVFCVTAAAAGLVLVEADGMRFLAVGEALEGFAVVVDDLDLGGNELNLCADLLFAHGRQGRATALADALFFGQCDEAFLMRELRQKFGCMVLLLLAALMRGHLDARLWRILLRFDLRLVEEIQLSICNLRQDSRCPFVEQQEPHLIPEQALDTLEAGLTAGSAFAFS